MSAPIAYPPINDRRIAVRVIPAAERAIRQGHPWLFADSITRVSHNGRSGDTAVIFDRKNRFLAVGLWDPHAPIRVRLLHHGDPTHINGEWIQAKLAAATERRTPLLDQQTNGYRLVHGENDGLGGVVIDRYAETAVIKLYTTAWLPHLPHLLEGLTQTIAPRRVLLRLSRHLQALVEPPFVDGLVLSGPPLNAPVQFLENGLTFLADLVEGQKTGFFLDQRDNRARVEQLAEGVTLLNVFAYTGGFSLYAARGGATAVTSLDQSQPALKMAQQIFAHNQHLARVRRTPHHLIAGDAFEELEKLAKAGQRYGMVVIDPPSFAQNQAHVDGALHAYGRLVTLGLNVLTPGGILVMASCSSRIAADAFFDLVHQTAQTEKRPLAKIERTTHALDHPIRFAEGAYLKCLFARA